MPVPRSIITAEPQDAELRVVAGEMPDGIGGHLVVSGPDTTTGAPYALFGPGRMWRMALEPGTDGAASDAYALRVNDVRTPSVRLLDARPDAFTVTSQATMGPLGMVNAANTAPLPWGDRLFATWDAGRPVEVDPVSLEFVAEVGTSADWPQFMPTPLLPFVFSTAHPVVDPERNCVWTVALVPASFAPYEVAVHLVRWSGDGTRVETWPVDGARISGTMHTITITRDWIVLIDSGNFKMDPGEMAGGDRTVLTDLDEPVHLIRKDAVDLTAPGSPLPSTSWFVGPSVGHYYGAWDDRDGVHVLFEHMVGMDLGFYLKPDDRDAYGDPVDPALAGMYNMAMAPSRVTEFVFDPDRGTVRERAVFGGSDRYWNLQLSGMDWSAEGMARLSLHHVVFQGFKPGNVSQRAVQLYAAAGRIDPAAFPSTETPPVLASLRRGGLEVASEWEFALDDLPTSPIFVPRGAGGDATRTRYAGTDPGGHDGWVVVPVLHDDGFRLDVFDAAAVGDGPRATLAAPRLRVPFLLHAAWMPRAVPVDPSVERLRFADEVAASTGIPADLRSDVDRVVAELDSVGVG